MVGAIDASTYEGIATTLFGHSQPVRTLVRHTNPPPSHFRAKLIRPPNSQVWSLQSKGPGHKIGWDEFIAFAEHNDHIPSTAEEWEKIVEVLGANPAILIFCLRSMAYINLSTRCVAS